MDQLCKATHSEDDKMTKQDGVASENEQVTNCQ